MSILKCVKSLDFIPYKVKLSKIPLEFEVLHPCNFFTSKEIKGKCNKAEHIYLYITVFSWEVKTFLGRENMSIAKLTFLVSDHL